MIAASGETTAAFCSGWSMRPKDGEDHMQGRPQALRPHPEENHSFKSSNVQEKVASEPGNCQRLGAGSRTNP